MSLNPFSNEPRRNRLTSRQQDILRFIGGIGFIVLGAWLMLVRNIDYPPGDFRGSLAPSPDGGCRCCSWCVALALDSLSKVAGSLAEIRQLSRPDNVWPVDREADTTLRRLAIALDSHVPQVDALIFLTALHGPPFTTPGSPWRTVGRCYRVVLARLGDPDAGSSPERTPLGAYRRAGQHYWRLALDRRVIGRPRAPSAWDEDVLLRCFLDEFDRLLPRGSSLTPFAGHEGWDAEARRRVDELRVVRLLHPMPIANRRLLVEEMEARLAVAIGDLSEPAVERMQSSATARNQGWQAPEESLQA